MTLLSVRGIQVRRGGRPVLSDVDLSVAAGECVGLIGPNGAGKSTLLSVMAGLLSPGAGTVELEGTALSGWSRPDRARRIGYLEQGATCHWPLTVERVVTLGRLPHAPPWNGEAAADRLAITRAMEQCDVAGLADRNVTALSGGERARVMLARALAGEPRLLLADEPAAGLDPYHQLQVMELLASLAADGMGVVVVLHDLTLALRHCTRLCLLDGQGRVAADGEPGRVLDSGVVENVYGIDLIRGGHHGMPYALPWQRRSLEAR